MAFDLDEFQQNFMNEQAQNQEQELSEEPEVTENVESVESNEEITEPEEVAVSTETDDVEAFEEKPKQTPEENKAFAEMRHKMKEMETKAKEAEKYQTFLNQIATSNGMTAEQVIQAYEEQNLKKQAEEKGVPLEVYQRLQTLEEENNRFKNEVQMERLRNEVDVVKAKYGLDDAEVKKAFDYIGEGGYFDPNSRIPTIRFEDAYFLANRDSLLERKTKEAQQQLLANKKQRQESAAISHGGQAGDVTTEPSWDRDSIEKKLNSMGLSLK